MTDRTERSSLASEDFANTTYDASHANLIAASGGGGGLATGPRDTASGKVTETPTEPMERPGTENAEAAADADSGIDAPRLTPQGRTGEDASDEDETDPMCGVKTGQRNSAEG